MFSPQYQQYVQYQHEPTVTKFEEMPRQQFNSPPADATAGYQQNPPPVPAAVAVPTAAGAIQKAPVKLPVQGEKSTLLDEDEKRLP